MCNHQINVFHCQQMDHKGGHWEVPEECIARTGVGQKAPLRVEAMLIREKIKPVALAVIELH